MKNDDDDDDRGAWKKRIMRIHTLPSVRGRDGEREAITPHGSDSPTRMNLLMTTFIQIRLIVIMVNN